MTMNGWMDILLRGWTWTRAQGKTKRVQKQQPEGEDGVPRI